VGLVDVDAEAVMGVEVEEEAVAFFGLLDVLDV
jgi:hypothetical protein